jgi:hypothetical protein
MVESKSGYSTNESNAHSDKIAKFGINRLNGLAIGSEWLREPAPPYPTVRSAHPSTSGCSKNVAAAHE